MKVLKIAGGVLALALALVGVGVAMSWAPDRPVETLTARWRVVLPASLGP